MTTADTLRSAIPAVGSGTLMPDPLVKNRFAGAGANHDVEDNTILSTARQR